MVQREGALDPARSKDSATYGQVLPYLLILAYTAVILTYSFEIHAYTVPILTHTAVHRLQNVACQVTELRHKGVKRKGNRTNRNPATAGMSVMNAELRESACERMAQVLDDHGLYVYVCVCICRYLVSMRMYVHISCNTGRVLTVTSLSQDLVGTSGAERNPQNRLNRQTPRTY